MGMGMAKKGSPAPQEAHKANKSATQPGAEGAGKKKAIAGTEGGFDKQAQNLAPQGDLDPGMNARGVASSGRIRIRGN